ncbi:metallophosphoesterase [Bacillus paralicheniformis]|uniref:metallophosphoesterase n=1 Tax=Bacillus TaxID=1386 RepID=UPI0003A8F5C3|nr:MULTISPECIES: metallophosphoesterase [Bacillus]MDE1382408.1 metallophosphoesterase [Bacillus paralicheniformis]MSN99750.1 metallophosphoesterase [Bacillus paralicheniformis]MSO03758.1 metallophosphoesterase [Bacillus paralicheniformis]MSO07751.1 metallophosphoesterase [Bacillus paralicheniformis]MSO11745.1 metallophosphoesterase [Bacillus paralicheniformis]
MKNPSRRQFLKGFLGLAAAGLFTAAGGLGYARYLEPHMLETNLIPIRHRLIPKGFDQFRIVQFSDTHLSEYFTADELSNVVSQVNALSPDLIVFSGDLIDKPHRYREHERAVNALKKLAAPYGKLAIFGNHDHGGYGTKVYQTLMASAGFRVLRNDFMKLELIDGSVIEIASLDDLMLGRPDYEGILSKLSEKAFSILLVHEPDAALTAKQYPVNLQISGHTHGGQIQIPVFGPLITPPYGEIYTEGMYETAGMKIYVNRGIGTTRLPLRFLSKPEITVFQLESI